MAEEQIVTRIVATSDFSNLIADLGKVSSALTNLQTKLNATNKNLAAQVAVMNRSFADTLRSTGQFSTHFVNLTSDVDKFGSQLDKGQIKLKQFFQVYQGHLKTNGGLIRQLAQQQVQLQNAILQPLGKNAEGLMQYNVHIPTGLDKVKSKTALARQELQIMNRVVQEGANSLINWGKNTQWAGRQLTVGLTVPLAAFGAASAKAFREADQELTRLTKVYGGLAATSASDLGKIRKQVTETASELSKAYGSSFKETIALGADIAATGKQGNELLGSIKETTRLAVLGEVDRQDAMKATLAIQSAFKQNTDELAESINFLNAVENQTSTTLNDLVEAIPKAGPIIKGLGGSVEDLALYLTAMREGGINASEGANALKSGLASLINPTKVAKEMFAGFGISLTDIVQKNAGNTTETLLALQSALDSLDPLQKQQALEQLFGKFQFARMNALFENLGKQGSQTLQVMDLMKASSEDLANIAGRELSMVTESASGKYRRALEGLKADLAAVGEQFLTINTHLINIVSGILKFIDKLPGPIKTILAFFGGLTAVAGPLIMLTGVLANFFGYVIKGASHFRAMFKGGEGWRLLTPEILAANKAGSLAEQTFYSDAKAADILNQAISRLSASYSKLAADASNAIIQTNPGVSTMGGTNIIAGQRVVNPNNPLAGKQGTRAAGHHIPRSQMSEATRQSQTIHSFTPLPIPLNQKIGAVPQIFTEGDLPKIPGLTTSGGASTGIVAGEAAKWHSLMGTLSMMTKREVADLKKEIARTGTFSTEINTTFGQLLPAMTKLTSNAASQSALIVQQLQAGKITLDTARAKIIAINSQLEAMMAQTTAQVATGLGRTANLTQVPLINQPIVGPTGKANIKEIFRPNRPSSKIIDMIARSLGVRTSGGGYSTETTIPKRMNAGGNVVPGVGNTDTVPAILTPGEFVVNKEATAANLPLLMAINKGAGNGGPGYNDGGATSLQSSHLMRSRELLEDPSIQKALVLSGQDPRRLTSLTFQGFGQGTAAALPRDINNSMAILWQGSQQETAIRVAENMNLPRHLRGDTIPLTNKDAALAAKFYRSLGQNRIASFFEQKNYQQDLIKRIALSSARARGTSSTKDFGLFYQEELAKTANAFKNGNTHQAITRGLINEFIVDPNTGKFRPDALKKAYVTNVSRQRVRVSTNTAVPYTINRGSEEYSARQAGRYGGGRWSNMMSLTSRVLSRGRIKMNAGGIVMPQAIPVPPQNGKYNMGGMVKGYNRGGIIPGLDTSGLNQTPLIQQMGLQAPQQSSTTTRGPGMAGNILSSAVMMGGFSGGAALGQKFGGNLGSLAGMMILPGILQSVIGKLTQLGSKSTSTAGLVGRLGPMLANPYVLAGAAVVGVIAGIVKYKKHTEEVARINRLGFAGGVKPIKDFDSQLKQVIKNIEDTRIAAELLHAQMNSAGIVGVSLTKKEFSDLRDKIKETYPELIKLFKQNNGDDLIKAAAGIKAQFIAAGDSAAEANGKIAALLAETGKSGVIRVVLGDSSVSEIKDTQTAILSMIDALSTLTDPKDRAGGTLQVLGSMSDYIDKAKDKTSALKEQFGLIEKSNQKNVKLTKEQISEIAKTDLIFAGMLKDTDTIGTTLAKWRIHLSGANKDLSTLSNSELEQFAMYAEKVASYYSKIADVSSKEAQSNSLTGSMAKEIDSWNKKQINAQKSITDGIQKQIDLKSKQIDQIKKEGDARKKALRDQQQSEDIKLQIQQEQLNYQTALAKGDMAGAAQAQISIQRLVGAQQLKTAEDAIDKAVQSKIDALQAQIDVLNKKSNAASSSASASAPKSSKLESTYQGINQLLKDVSMSGNVATVEQVQRFNDLILQLQKLPNSKKYLDELGNPTATNLDVKDRPFGPVIGQTDISTTAQYASLKSILEKGSSSNLVAGKIDTSNTLLKQILDKLPGLKDADYTVSPNQPLSVPAAGWRSGRPGPTDSTPNTGWGGYADAVNKKPGRLYTPPGASRYIMDSAGNAVYENLNPKEFKAIAKQYNTKLAMGGIVKKYATAGFVSGPGTGTSDSIPAMLSNGEYVIRAAAVQSVGTSFLDGINKMSAGGIATKYSVPRMNMGGKVYMSNGGQAPSNALYNINVTLNGTELTADDVARTIEQRMRRMQSKQGPSKVIA
jgi:TP901 family phage tail tape measure protein